jgi:ribonucleoside-diphosphate reductase beta chain
MFKKSVFLSNNYHDSESYPELTTIWKNHENAHWTIDEVRLSEDKKRWNSGEIDDETKDFLTNIFRFFTQADEDVHDAYADVYIPVLRNQTVRKMMSSFFARESVHVEAYKKLVIELGMPNTIFKEFLDYKEMQAKHDYLRKFSLDGFKPLSHYHKELQRLEAERLEYSNYPYTKMNQLQGIDAEIKKTKEDIVKLYLQTARNIGVFSAFTEGMHLFSSFIMLLNLCKEGVVLGMYDVIKWSIIDETMHYEGMFTVYNMILQELADTGFVTDIDKVSEGLQTELTEIAKEMVQLEDAFVDLCFTNFKHHNLSAQEVKQYTRYICDRRLISLGCKPLYKIKDNPLPWVDKMLNANIHGNFFETAATDYTKAFIQPTMLDEICDGMLARLES